MIRTVSKKASGLKGKVDVPGDKSISHRALMLGAVAEGETVIRGLLESDDIESTARALRALGVSIVPPPERGGVWRVAGVAGGSFRTPASDIFLGNSGTSARLLMGLVAGHPVSAVFTGDASLQRRPMARVIDPLTRMGARIETREGATLPLKITGASPLRPLRYRLPVASAQVKSAILLAGLRAAGATVVEEPQPTRDHTERMLRLFGASVASESNSVMLEGGAVLRGCSIDIPADPSAAAFLTVAALVTPESDILLPNVLMNPLRSGLYDTLIDMGADISFENRRSLSGEPVADLRVRSSALKGVTVPPSRVPSMIDEFPILAVAAAVAEGETAMSDLTELRVKESDRLTAMAEGLAAAGVRVAAEKDGLRVTGGAVAGGCTVDARLDHRIAMSFLVLGLVADAPIAVAGTETISSSFPDFVPVMRGLGSNF